jgi:hypothetical protein
MSAEYELFKTLDGLSTSANEKVAHSLESLSISELETILRNEGMGKEASALVNVEKAAKKTWSKGQKAAVGSATDLGLGGTAALAVKAHKDSKKEKKASAELDLVARVEEADKMGRDLARQHMEKSAFADHLVGGVIGHKYGTEQKARGEKYSFGGPQAASLLLPGGAGYQVGRFMAHHNESSKSSHSKKKAKTKSKTKTSSVDMEKLALGIMPKALAMGRSALRTGVNLAATSGTGTRAAAGAIGGAALGAVKPKADGQSRLGNMAKGAVGGAAIGAVAGPAVKGVAKMDNAVGRATLKAGIKGQAGAAKVRGAVAEGVNRVKSTAAAGAFRAGQAMGK